MATIGLLLSVIEADLSTLEPNLVNNGRLKKVRQLRAHLGDALDRTVVVPEPEPVKSPKIEPSEDFWKALEEPSVEKADDAAATKDESAPIRPGRSKSKDTSEV